MTEYTEYKVLHAETTNELEAKVNEHMADRWRSWQPLGGIKPTVTEKSTPFNVNVEFYQAMVR